MTYVQFAVSLRCEPAAFRRNFDELIVLYLCSRLIARGVLSRFLPKKEVLLKVL